MTSIHQILICQNRSCRKAGAQAILIAFQRHSSSRAKVIGCGCLGRCGNGPNVLILPSETWHHYVHPDDVARLVESMLTGSQPNG